jgi:hypothetical protein
LEGACQEKYSISRLAYFQTNCNGLRWGKVTAEFAGLADPQMALMQLQLAFMVLLLQEIDTYPTVHDPLMVRGRYA